MNTRKSAGQARSAQLKRVFRRDGGVCQCCGYTVYLDVWQGHRQKASRGHIVSIANGGSDADDNIQLECEWCNKTNGSQDRSMPRRFPALTQGADGG